ncbi:MAG TPA: RNA methyltransferase [Phycisphaeraceae bacterium]
MSPHQTHAPRVLRVESVDDPRLRPYRHLKGQDLARQEGLFVCEGEHLTRRLLASRFKVHSILAAEHRAAALLPHVPESTPVYVAPEPMLAQIAGYPFHLGVLACGHRPPAQTIDALPASPMLAVCPVIFNPENLGLIIRTAAALGAGGLLLGQRGADVLSRRVVRVSMGAVFTLPIAQSADLEADLIRLRDEQGVELVATVLEDGAVPLHQYQPPARVAVLMGSEPQGLEPQWLNLCQQRITIPMHRGVDSLNVAVALGVVLYELSQQQRR